MSPRWVLGVDFGTSYTLAATREEGQRPEVVEIDGERRVPSVAMVDDGGRIVVGRDAEAMSAAAPDSVVRALKSSLGASAPIVLRGRTYAAADLVAALLSKVYAETVRHHGSAPISTRLTHPAAWTASHREQLASAARAAELPAVLFVPEPVGAALSYSDAVGLADGQHTAVYDLGGGTFDCAVVQAGGGSFKVVGRPAGDPDVGGELFDEIIAQAIGERLDDADWQRLQAGDEIEWRRSWIALHQEARRAKELLSTQTAVDVRVSLPHGSRGVRLARGDVEALVTPHLEPTVHTLARAISAAGITPADLHSIALVGGASRMPVVQRLLADRFPDVPISRRGDPKAAVALGATHPSIGAASRPAAPSTIAIPQNATPALQATGRARPRRWLLALPAAALLAIAGSIGMMVMADDPDDPDRSASSGPSTTGAPGASDAPTTLSAGALTTVPGAVVSGREIAFASSDGKDNELYSINADASGLDQMTVNSVNDQYPAWSPDGTLLAWMQGDDIMTMRANKTGLVNLTADIDDHAEKPAWTPDGTGIVFVRKVNDIDEVWTMSAVDGTAKRGVVTYEMEQRDAYDPTVAPDGTIFYSSRAGPDRSDIWVTDLQASSRRQLIAINGDQLVNEVVDVTRDGTRITFSQYAAGGQYDVYVAAPDGSGASNLTTRSIGGPVASDGPSDWAADGQRLAVVSTIDGGDHDLWILDTASGGATQLTANGVSDLDPDWRPIP
jgi:Tol biopolymer transport system component/actin-like ATPase involved in cell morphogenesis